MGYIPFSKWDVDGRHPIYLDSLDDISYGWLSSPPHTFRNGMEMAGNASNGMSTSHALRPKNQLICKWDDTSHFAFKESGSGGEGAREGEKKVPACTILSR